MLKCKACGAGLPDTADICSYCGVATDVAQLKAEEQIAADAERADAKTNAARESLGRTSTHALVWSIVGMIVCCPPIPSIVGLVMSLRARKMARKYTLVLPATATAGLAMSLVGISIFTLFVIYIVTEERRVSARQSELAKIVDAYGAGPTLDERTACALAESRLLEDGWGETGKLSVDDFRCPGRVIQRGNNARLEDITFKGTKKSRPVLTGCYHRGSRWTLDELREDTQCTTSSIDDPATDPVEPTD